MFKTIFKTNLYVCPNKWVVSIDEEPVSQGFIQTHKTVLAYLGAFIFIGCTIKWRYIFFIR